MFISNAVLASAVNSEMRYNNISSGLNLPYRENFTPDRKSFFNDDDLDRMKDFVLTLNMDRISSNEELKEILGEFKILLTKLNRLDNLAVIIESSKEYPMKIDTSFLDYVRPYISRLVLKNIDLNELEPEDLGRFQNLSYLYLYNNNMDRCDSLLDLNMNTRIHCQKNPGIYSHDRDRLCQYIVLRHGGIRGDIRSINDLSDVINERRIDLESFSEIYEYIKDYDTDIIRIEIKDEPSQNAISMLEKYSSDINRKEHFIFRGNFAYIREIISKCNIRNRCYADISKVNEISDIYLMKHRNIRGIFLNNDSTGKEQKQMYTVSDFIEIKSKIKEIIKNTLPLFKSQLNEKEIFTRIYFELANKIEYDFNAIDREHNEDYSNSIRCRNLAGGLIDRKCVCAGYADILKEVCGQVGIEADYIQGFTEDCGHAWNRVKLDGRYYYVDLTWDRNDIVNRNFPLRYFLKSEKDFHHQQYSLNLSFDTAKSQCNESVSIAEQYELIESKDRNLKDIFSNYISDIREMIRSRNIADDMWEIEPVIERLEKEMYNQTRISEDGDNRNYISERKGRFYDYEKDGREDY